jgi:glucoamylase
VEFPGVGPSFRRYLGDKYGYDETTGAQTMGMPWPILTGERGHYEIALAVAQGKDSDAIDETAGKYVTAMESLATPSHFIPEQVWDLTNAEPGTPTGAATPLGWAHGEYLKLLRSRMDQKVFDLEGMPKK